MRNPGHAQGGEVNLEDPLRFRPGEGCVGGFSRRAIDATCVTIPVVKVVVEWGKDKNSLDRVLFQLDPGILMGGAMGPDPSQCLVETCRGIS
jgi:hypothetical protein